MGAFCVLSNSLPSVPICQIVRSEKRCARQVDGKRNEMKNNRQSASSQRLRRLKKVIKGKYLVRVISLRLRR